MSTLAAYPAMMRRDRQRLGLRECRAAWLLGVTVREYRELEAGDQTLIQAEVWERMIDVFGRPRLETWINGTSKRLHVITRMEEGDGQDVGTTSSSFRAPSNGASARSSPVPASSAVRYRRVMSPYRNG